MRKAFSLIELLIVVLIVGIVYTLAITNFDTLKENTLKPTLLSLKSFLKDTGKQDYAQLICLDKCKSCYVFVDQDKVYDENASEFFEDFFDEEPKLYSYDPIYGLLEQKNKVYFNSEDVQEEICFSLSVDKNGVSDQVIVEYKDEFYDFTSYFKATQVYSSASEFKDMKNKLKYEVLR